MKQAFDITTIFVSQRYEFLRDFLASREMILAGGRRRLFERGISVFSHRKSLKPLWAVRQSLTAC